MLLPTLIILISLRPEADYRMLAIYANNVHHMTIERATTPRINKRFRVLDAESGEPLPGARIIGVHDFDWMDDWVVRGTTDAQGFATLRLAKNYFHLFRAHVKPADEYLGRDWPEPGADVTGIAAWHIGTTTPNGPWGAVYHHVVIGDRAAAIDRATELWREHRNARGGGIYNGWRRVVAPEVNVSGPAYGGTSDPATTR